MKRKLNHSEVERIQVVMLKKQLSDRQCADLAGRSLADWKDIVFKKKSEDDTTIKSMLERLEQ